jgi:hypothetical protein
MLRIQSEHALEIGASLFRISTHNIVIPDVVEERSRGGPLLQNLLVDAFGISALMLRVQTGRLPESVILRRRWQREND